MSRFKPACFAKINLTIVSLAIGAFLTGCGEIGSPCTSAGTPACPIGSFCKLAEGSCDDELTSGVCTETPDECTLEYAPVCGCDGETYGNECGAHSAGVNIAHSGECDDGEGETCGGLQGLECGDGEFCNFEDRSCGAADQTGVCEEIPQFCPEIYAPICGCDDQTYDNECLAHAEGVSVAGEGPCTANGQPCGGALDFDCNGGEFCQFADGICGIAEGVCTEIPSTCPELFAPVCGCDGETYGNRCEANAASISVASDGECEDIVIRECGGLQGLPCEEGEFCNFTDGSCGAADQIGVCEVIPEGCDDVFEPVCGCDGETYGNECEAAAAGVSVASEGECP